MEGVQGDYIPRPCPPYPPLCVLPGPLHNFKSNLIGKIKNKIKQIPILFTLFYFFSTGKSLIFALFSLYFIFEIKLYFLLYFLKPRTSFPWEYQYLMG